MFTFHVLATAEIYEDLRIKTHLGKQKKLGTKSPREHACATPAFIPYLRVVVEGLCFPEQLLGLFALPVSEGRFGRRRDGVSGGEPRHHVDLGGGQVCGCYIREVQVMFKLCFLFGLLRFQLFFVRYVWLANGSKTVPRSETPTRSDVLGGVATVLVFMWVKRE